MLPVTPGVPVMEPMVSSWVVAPMNLPLPVRAMTAWLRVMVPTVKVSATVTEPEPDRSMLVKERAPLALIMPWLMTPPVLGGPENRTAPVVVKVAPPAMWMAPTEPREMTEPAAVKLPVKTVLALMLKPADMRVPPPMLRVLEPWIWPAIMVAVATVKALLTRMVEPPTLRVAMVLAEVDSKTPAEASMTPEKLAPPTVRDLPSAWMRPAPVTPAGMATTATPRVLTVEPLGTEKVEPKVTLSKRVRLPPIRLKVPTDQGAMAWKVPPPV
eukprot:77539_1